MVHQLITVSDTCELTDTIWAEYDRRLEIALNSVDVAVSILLQPIMGHGIGLIHWLEGWNKRFNQQHKNFIIIAEDYLQFQCLELSHPVIGLVYIASVNDIPALLKKLTEGTKYSSSNTHKVQEKSTLPIKDSVENTEVTDTLPLVSHSEETVPVETIPDVAAEKKTAELLTQHDSVDDEKKVLESSDSVRIKSEGTEKSIPYKTSGNRTDSILPCRETIHVDYRDVIEITGEYQCDTCGATRMFNKGDRVEPCENRECSSEISSYTLLHDLF